MKKIGDFLFSSKMMAVVLALFAVSIAVATFIENDFGSSSARALVYNARWFEFLLLIGIINLSGTIVTKELYRKEKFTVFLFHLSFIVILIGAAITRFTGFEGSMSIREGESSRAVLTDRTYLEVRSGDNENSWHKIFPVFFSERGGNKFKSSFNYNGTDYQLRCKSFVANAVPEISPDSNGKPFAELVYTDAMGRKNLIIAAGEQKSTGTITFSFQAPESDTSAVQLTAVEDSLFFTAPFPVSRTGMTDQTVMMLGQNESHRFYPLQLYAFKGNMLVLSKYFSSGKISARPISRQEGQTNDAILMELIHASGSSEFLLWGKQGYAGTPVLLEQENSNLLISYGSLYKDISFELKLNDFIIQRYPGSNSPSWFESRVTLTDSNRGIHEQRRIFMNNILKYKGYRFYQSSYTSDERGTILSVNRDWAGTLVTYAGYFLMALGMMLSLFNANSRFRTLSHENALLKAAKKSLLLLVAIISFQGVPFAQDPRSSVAVEPVDQEHARLFGRMLVQDNGGRIKPVNTLSSEVLRKLSRKSNYNGMTPDQVFLGMMLDPTAWQHEPFIRATHPQIQEIMGSDDKYFAFISFFRDDNYILHDHVERAFHKKPALRSKFDNEIIRLDERVNICYLVFTGELLRILPRSNDSTHTWFSHQGIQGKVDLEDSVFVENIIPMYLQDVQQSMKTADWKSPEEILGAITRYQEKYSGDLMPPPRDISLEIFLNKSDIFDRISNYYGIVGFLLLLLQFIALFYPRIKLKIPVIISIVLIIIIFMIHTTGLGLRWYVSGHAPWSNGYEALTYIAWATVLAGLIFSGRSSITLSATAVLAFLILHTAHLSWMDPQITNLVPVLKSYWLVIHVATITASYGFLALGALLACINILLMVMQTGKNYQYINLTVRELSNIIEMTLIAGLYLLVIGTFLGGVWANESWGRYWGWDPKETWALVTVLVYAFIAHMRMVPGLKGVYTFNLASLLGFSTVIMTYFGVNFYLSGLHSYAKGDPLPVPSFVYYTLVIIFVIALVAFINYRRLERDNASQDR